MEIIISLIVGFIIGFSVCAFIWEKLSKNIEKSMKRYIDEVERYKILNKEYEQLLKSQIK